MLTAAKNGASTHVRMAGCGRAACARHRTRPAERRPRQPAARALGPRNAGQPLRPGARAAHLRLAPGGPFDGRERTKADRAAVWRALPRRLLRGGHASAWLGRMAARARIRHHCKAAELAGPVCELQCLPARALADRQQKQPPRRGGLSRAAPVNEARLLRAPAHAQPRARPRAV